MAHIIKLDKNEDVLSVIKKIKKLRENEVIFVLEQGSKLLRSSANMKLMRRTGETLDKVIKIETDDKVGRVLAAKAGVLADGRGVDTRQLIKKTVTKSNLKKSKVKPNFSDVRGSRRILPKGTTSSLAETQLDAAEVDSKEGYMDGGSLSVNWKKIGKWGIAGTGLIVAIGLILGLLMPEASVTIYARSEPVTRDLEIKIDSSFDTVDSENLILPGVKVVKEVSQTENFETTGTSLTGTKSSGQVILYNFTSNTFRLNQSTTTLVAEGKEFKFLADASGIRPTQGSSEQDADPKTLVPALDVIAADVGDSFNISANTKFEIRNSALGNRSEVYAINAKAFTGGASIATLILSQEDYEMAKSKLVEGVRAEAEVGLRADVNNDLRLLASGVSNEILAEASDIKIGEPANQFDLTLIARLTGLAYNVNHIENLVINQIESVLSEGKYILSDTTNEVQASFKELDLENGRGVLSVHFETAVAYEVNSENLSTVLTGKSATEIKEILLTKPEVDRVDVEFSPFWVRKAPNFSGKVQVKTVLSEL